MITTDQAQRIIDHGTVVGTDGEKIGKVGQVYLDDQTGEPAWVTVKTGLFGSGESFVPLAEATVAGDDVRVPYGKDKVKDAPRVEEDGQISPAEEDELYRYYGLGTGTTDATYAAGTDASYATGTTGGDARGTVGPDTSGPTTDDAMTRSEEQLKVGTQTVETGRARLRKYVVTEQQTVNVPVTHEEVRVTREPITDANRDEAYSGPAISEEEHEVVLHGERAVVDKEAVAVERVRLDVDQVSDTERVTDEVRKEVIETEGVETRGTDRI